MISASGVTKLGHLIDKINKMTKMKVIEYKEKFIWVKLTNIL